MSTSSVPWQKYSENEDYKHAAEVTESLWPPAEGFLGKAKGESLSSGQTITAVAKQNNLILTLLVDISRHIQSIDGRLLELEKNFANKGITDPTLSHSIEELTKGLEKIKISTGSTVPIPPREPKIYVYKNPYTAVQEELRKSQKK